MKLCRVLIPFTDKETGADHKAGDEIALSDERIAQIREVNINMVQVLKELPEPEPAEAAPDEAPDVPDVEEIPEKKPKKKKSS